MKTRYVLSCLLLGSALSVSAQKTAVKSNLLSAANGALNAGVEYAFGPKSTFDLSGSIRPWKRTEGYVNKYWLTQRMHGSPEHSDRLRFHLLSPLHAGKRQLGRHTGSTCRHEYIETDGE